MHRLIITTLIFGISSCTSPKNVYEVNHLPRVKQEVNFSPINWGEGVLEEYLEMDNRAFPDNPTAEGFNGAVTNTYHAAASRAGLEALKQGGTSVDAAMTVALTQVTLNAGAVVSFFGIMNMVHYDASTGEMVSMDATWNTVQEEDDPMSIPGGISSASAKDLYKSREISGRTALVGGFIKGLEEAHRRYGKLSFNQLFEPAIFLAEKGFELSVPTAKFFKYRDQQIRRLPETRSVLVKPGGDRYEAGDIFQQTALARTLKKIAKEGSAYMYKGEWGEKAIKAIQRDGGKMTMKDLEDYEVIWNEPIKANYGEYEVAVLGPPVNGSVNLIEALNLAIAAGIPEQGHWSENGESFKEISDVTNTFLLSYLPEITRNMFYPNINLADSSRIKKETSDALWKKIEEGIKIARYADKLPKHSDTVVAIDKWGNMTAVTHSINCVTWGNEAIMVDGISIGDAASIQQTQIARIAPGSRLPSPIEVGIISKNGIPVIPFASMATGLHQQTVQSILNIVAFDMDIGDAIEAPSIFLPQIDTTNPFSPAYTVRVMKGDFPPDVMESSGLPVMEIEASERRYTQGLWIGIHRSPDTGKLKAVSPPYATGRGLAY